MWGGYRGWEEVASYSIGTTRVRSEAAHADAGWPGDAAPEHLL